MTSTIEKPVETPTFEVGQRVAVEGYEYPGWNGPAIVTQVGDYISVKLESGEMARFEGAFEPKYIAPLPDSYSVHDVEGLDALPVGALLRDTQGYDVRKFEGEQYSYTYAHEPMPEGYDALTSTYVSLPAVLLNPEILEPALLYRKGDEVVLNDSRSRMMNAQPGSRAVVTQDYSEGDTYLMIRWTDIVGVSKQQMDGGYYASDFDAYVEPEPTPEPEPLSPVAGERYVVTQEGTHGFSVGTVVRALEPNAFGSQMLCTTRPEGNPFWELGVTAFLFPRELEPYTEPKPEPLNINQITVGDRLRLVAPHVIHPGGNVFTAEANLGDVGEVQSVYTEDGQVSIAWDNSSAYSSIAHICCLERVVEESTPEPEPEQPVTSHDGIAVGDKVRVLTNAFTYVNLHSGDEGEVTSLDGAFIKVKTSTTTLPFPFARSELEKIEEPVIEEPTTKFEVGQEVRIKNRVCDPRFYDEVAVVTAVLDGVPQWYLTKVKTGFHAGSVARFSESNLEAIETPEVAEVVTVHDDEGLDSLGNGSVIRLLSAVTTPIRAKVDGTWHRVSQDSDAADHLTRLLVKEYGAEVLLAL